MKRKIVQIACMPANDPGAVPVIFALADDGTVWGGCSSIVGHHMRDDGMYLGPKFEWAWDQIPSLPDNNSNLSKVKE